MGNFCGWEGKMIDYKAFKDLAERYKAGKMARNHFILCWRIEQRDKGITPAPRDVKKYRKAKA
jgi:hypothetical protein